MADILASAAIRAVSGGGDVAGRMAQLREAMTNAQQGGGIAPQSGVLSGDEAKRYSIDVGKGEGTSFGDALTRALNEVSGAQDRATDYVEKFIRGEPVELHQVMAATEEANISLEMLVEMRNKLTEAYRTVMQMQS